MNPSSPLSAYTADVERFFDEQSSTIISNKDREHAAILISTLFKKSLKEILVLSRHLDGDFYTRESICGELKKAVLRGVKVKILIQEKTQQSADQEKLISDLKSSGVQITYCSNSSRGSSAPLNFTVVDHKAYRLESDRNTHEAYACANDKDVAAKLINLFQFFETEHEGLEIKRMD